MAQDIQAVVVDLGDVLFSWTAPKDAPLTGKALKRAMSYNPWFEFERDRISEQECYQQIGEIMSVAATDVEDTIRSAKISLKADRSMIEALEQLKREKPSINLFLMSNISKPHWQFVRDLSSGFPWQLFNETFISAEVGMRKPDLCFFNHVVGETGVTHPGSILFIDDRLDNINMAASLGIQVLHFDQPANVVPILLNRVLDPVGRGRAYLRSNAKRLLTTVTGPGFSDMEIKDNYAQLLILEATKDLSLVEVDEFPLLYNYFSGPPILSTATFPDDFDTTSLACLTRPSLFTPEKLDKIMDESLKHQSEDHLPLTYQDQTRPRPDPCIIMIVYTLFHINGRGKDLQPTFDFICQYLYHKAYETGTYYYPSPDYWLYYCSRLVERSGKAGVALPSLKSLPTCPTIHQEYGTFQNLLLARCRDRLNFGPSSALDLATRIIACRKLGVPATDLHREARRLRDLQQVDGGWPWCAMYKIPQARAEIGSRGVITAWAVEALSMIGQESRKPTASMLHTTDADSVQLSLWSRSVPDLLAGAWRQIVTRVC